MKKKTCVLIGNTRYVHPTLQISCIILYYEIKYITLSNHPNVPIYSFTLIGLIWKNISNYVTCYAVTLYEHVEDKRP